MVYEASECNIVEELFNEDIVWLLTTKVNQDGWAEKVEIKFHNRETQTLEFTQISQPESTIKSETWVPLRKIQKIPPQVVTENVSQTLAIYQGNIRLEKRITYCLDIDF